MLFHFLPVVEFKELISISSLTKQCWAGCSQPFTEVGEWAYSRFYAVQRLRKAQEAALVLKQGQFVEMPLLVFDWNKVWGLCSNPFTKTFSVKSCFQGEHQFTTTKCPQLVCHLFQYCQLLRWQPVNYLLYRQSSGEELLPSAKRTKLEDVMENVNNAYASQDEVKEKSGNLCTLFEKDGNLFRFFQSCSVCGGAEQVSLFFKLLWFLS